MQCHCLSLPLWRLQETFSPSLSWSHLAKIRFLHWASTPWFLDPGWKLGQVSWFHLAPSTQTETLKKQIKSNTLVGPMQLTTGEELRPAEESHSQWDHEWHLLLYQTSLSRSLSDSHCSFTIHVFVITLWKRHFSITNGPHWAQTPTKNTKDNCLGCQLSLYLCVLLLPN
jgi:hypothetical protein